LLLAALDLRVGFALVVENFSGHGVVSLHLDFLGALENGCMEVPFCAFKFRGSFADREVGSGRSRYGCEFPYDFPWNWRLMMLGHLLLSVNSGVYSPIPLYKLPFSFEVNFHVAILNNFVVINSSKEMEYIGKPNYRHGSLLLCNWNNLLIDGKSKP
jgi:hypothetical protein